MDAQFLKDQVNFIEAFKIGFLEAIKSVARELEKEESAKAKELEPSAPSGTKD